MHLAIAPQKSISTFTHYDAVTFGAAIFPVLSPAHP